MYNSILEENLKLRTKISKLKKDANEGFPDSPLNKSVNIIGRLRSNVKDLKGDIKYKDKEITQLKKHIRYTRISDLESSIDQHLSDKEKLKLSNQELVDQISHMVDDSLYQSAIDSHESTKEVLESIKQELSSSRQTNEDLVSQILALHEDYKSQISILHEAYNSQISSLTGDNESQISALNEEIESYKSQITVLNETIEDQKSQISGLNDLVLQGNELNQELTRLRAEDEQTIESLRQEICEKDRQIQEILEEKENTILEIQNNTSRNIELAKEDNLRLLEEITQTKEAKIAELNEEIESLKTVINKGSQEKALNRLADYLIRNSIAAEMWVKKISEEEKLRLREVKKALYNSDIEIDEDDLNKLIREFSRDDQIDAQDLIRILSVKESQMTVEDMFEMFKARAGLVGTRSVIKKLEKVWTEDLLSKELIEKLSDSKVFTLEVEDKEQFSNFFMIDQENIEKNTAVNEVMDRFGDWEGLTVADLKEYIEKIYSFLQENNDQVVLAFQEKFPMTGRVRLTEILKTFDSLSLVANNIERSCLRCIVFYISGNVTKIDYLQILSHFFEKNFDDGLFAVLENKAAKEPTPAQSGRSKKSRLSERLDTPRSNLDKSDRSKRSENGSRHTPKSNADNFY